MIRYWHNGEIQLTDIPSADTTLLEYLRDVKRLKGTKEGCAAGDCGACTVVLISSQKDGKLVYEAVNSCLLPVAELNGKGLVTIEDLATKESLHPLQESFISQHASQCGFCTPGFVMSAFALKHHNAEPTHHEIDLALGGNLCRCTGYGPIVKAVEQSECKGDQYDQQAAEIAKALNEIAQSEATAPSFLQPRNLESLFGYWRNHPNARIIAGGTDLMLEVTQQLKTLPVLISTLRVEELQTLSIDSEVLTIGAGVSLTRLYDFAKEAELHALVYLLERFAAYQIRNRATVGGSIANASPIGDLAPILLAFNAEVDIVSAKERRSLPLEQFFKGYRATDLQANEIIQGFKVPLNRFKRICFEKVSKRMDDDISAVAIAMAVTINNRAIESLSVGLGGVAATPYKLTTTTQQLCGKDVDALSAKKIEELLSKEISPMSDLRATAAYRLTTAANLIHAMLCDAAEEV